MRRPVHARPETRPTAKVRLPRLVVPAAFAAVSALIAPLAAAEPLTTEACESLRRELAELEGGPAAASFARGADWGKSNLSPEQLKLVQRLIALREDVAFRCRPALVQMETPPAPVDPDKVPLPERNPTPRPVTTEAASAAQQTATVEGGDKDTGASAAPNQPQVGQSQASQPPPPSRPARPDPAGNAPR